MQHLAKLGVLNLDVNFEEMNFKRLTMKKNQRHVYALIALCFLLGQGCTQRWWWNNDPIPGTFRLDAQLEWNAMVTELGDANVDHLGHTLRLDNLQMYISEMELRAENGEWEFIGDVALLDFSVLKPHILAPVPAGVYDAIRFGVGLPSEINTDMDPASYPNDHPLSVPGSAGMFWTWSSGYVFVKYEGKFAAEPGQPLLEPLSYHCGTDSSFRSVMLEFEEPLLIQSRELTVQELVFDAALSLVGAADSIDIVADPVTHNASGTTLGGRIMDLMDDAWSLR